MSRSAKVNTPFAGKRRDFRLGVEELDELDELCKVGPGYLLGLVSQGVSGNWKSRQLREVLRLGLIGGGTSPNEALRVIERYFDTERNPLGDSLVTVQLVLMACVVGDEDDPPGEPTGETTPSLSPVGESVSALSTRLLAPSASQTLDVSASGNSTASSPAGAAPTALTSPRRGRSRKTSEPS